MTTHQNQQPSTEPRTALTYEAVRVEHGTPYIDEPPEVIPAGWWIWGWSGTNDECPDVLIYIDFAVDRNGFDWSEALGKRVAALLNQDAHPAHD
ncbi:hypothetical protein [Amycolatopsis nigrescens]|uniref:hypothetical protein n=1 Tax=Amycolatopsis nigrescens TaxID=381445 RepID=UPI00036363C4|nr:hypothetical protein [Amycolatopsis nigrescens]